MAIEQPNAEILVNYPPMIPGATRNVIPYTPVPPEEVVEGAPLALFKPVLNQQGVLANAVKVLVDPPPRDTPSDDSISIELRLNGVSLENRPIPVADRDQRTEFTLFESSLLDDRNNRLEYKIHRPSGNVADSRPLWVLYSEQLPGGNTVPGDDEHPYLDISLPPELGDPPVIGKDDVDKGVALTVFYPFMKAYDDISVELRRERFTFTVQPAQVGQPVVIPLTRAMFEQAGNSADFAISYTVVDQLNNPTQRRRWSITLKADVDVNRVVLDAPILREDLTDTGDDASIVDRDKLNGAPLNVVVVPKKPQFEVGDLVAGRYTGTPSGMDVEFTGPIETDGFGGFKLCIMRIPNDQVVLDDQARAAFTLRRNGIDVGTSKTATARVIGKGAITLNPPTLVAPATSPIDALAYTNGVTARVTFAANPGDRALLKEINPAPGAMPFAEQDFIAGRSDFILSPAFLVARQGKDIELTWTLIRGGMPVGESLPLGLRVNPMADGDTRLPTPTITAVTDGVTLDLTRFSGNTNVLVDAWRGIAINQPIWMQGDGTTVSGDPVTLPIHRGVPITSTGSQGGVVTRAFLDQLADGSTIKVIVAVNVDGFPNEATSVKFPARTYTVKAVALATPAITSVKGSPSGVEIPHGKETTETSLTLTGTASAGQTVQLYNGGSPIGGVITVGADRNWTITLTGLSVATYSIVARGLYGTQPQSPARSVIVTAIVTPAITSIKGSPSGVEIPHGKETTETSLTLTGTASAGQTVQLYNGGSPIGGIITVGADRSWTITLTGLSVATYSIVARGLYGTQPQSPARSVIVTAIVTPTITSVKGSPSGVEIPHGKETTETSLTLTGTASAGQTVQLYNGGSPIGGVITVGADRNWTITLTGLSVATYSIVARGLYGTQPQSPARSVIVTAIVTPTITSVKGSPSGVEIPHGKETTETSLTLTGTASAGQKVQLYNGGSPIGGVITVGADRNWTITLTGLSVATYSIVARGLYGTQPQSPARSVIVTAIVTPAITSIKGSPSGVEIPHGKETTETSLTLTGTASAGQTVQLYNGSSPIGGIITVGADRSWIIILTNLVVATYSFVARGLYGTQPQSPARTLTVIRPVLSENFDSVPSQSISTVKIELPSMTLFAVSADRWGYLGEPIFGPTPGKLENNCVILRYHSIVIRLELKSTYVEVGFWYRALESANRPSISFYDDKGIFITSESFPVSNPAGYYKYSSAKGFKYIELKTGNSDFIMVDNFSFKI
ncbi:hypothetical protein HKK52_02205 [Pseudomonas sp. ADAK2]|uniref:Ig-like domain-containing protein n=1 Tax=unclassified Pseudomonas TaxID=196821 RepID=UPI001463B505|nr:MULTISPECIES: Ig-like domain-containing protein [unclassified Pseudomonas]QJI39785.1 hypothetical protein HKK53_02205 [Pseudomonas sp. ADAK7]QJI46091.1 hypothetical protein HKK52_02205 [Pseudomonas sp. ADAK2]